MSKTTIFVLVALAVVYMGRKGGPAQVVADTKQFEFAPFEATDWQGASVYDRLSGKDLVTDGMQAGAADTAGISKYWVL